MTYLSSGFYNVTIIIDMVNYNLMGEVNLLHYLILVTYRLVCLLNWLVTIRIYSSFFTDFMFTCRQKLVVCIWL
jgi:hypothetical protein